MHPLHRWFHRLDCWSPNPHVARMNAPDPITRLSAALEGRYRIESELGEGGMAPRVCVIDGESWRTCHLPPIAENAMRLYIRTVPILLVAALVSCGGTESPTDARTPVATTLTVSPTSVSFSSLGATEQLTATVFDQNGATMTGASVAWTSSASSVATVLTAGVVQAESNGFTTITASVGSIDATAEATVEQVVAVIARSPDSILVAVGQSVTVIAASTDSRGSVVSGACPVPESRNPSRHTWGPG